MHSNHLLINMNDLFGSFSQMNIVNMYLLLSHSAHRHVHVQPSLMISRSSVRSRTRSIEEVKQIKLLGALRRVYTRTNENLLNVSIRFDSIRTA